MGVGGRACQGGVGMRECPRLYGGKGRYTQWTQQPQEALAGVPVPEVAEGHESPADANGDGSNDA